MTAIIFNSCNSDDDYYSRLPPETQTGENTFGCLIDGKLFYPRDGYRGLGGSGARAIRFIGSTPPLYNELDVNNFRDGRPINFFTLHIHNLRESGEGFYDLKQSNFNNGPFSLPQTHLYIRAFHEPSGGFKWYGTTENSGELIITRYDLSERIVSGTFSGILKERNGV